MIITVNPTAIAASSPLLYPSTNGAALSDLRGIRAAVEDTITLAGVRPLVVLDSRGPMKLIGLAELLAVNPSAATRMVARHVAVDMVDRQPNPGTRREVVIGLTPVGRQVVRGITERRRAEIADIVARMPESTRCGLVEALIACAEAGGEPPADVPPGDTAWF